jgi:hypothetical protein
MAARQVLDAIERLRDDLARQNRELQQVIDAHTPQGSAAAVGLALRTCATWRRWYRAPARC